MTYETAVTVEHDNCMFDVLLEVTPYEAPVYLDCNMTGPGNPGGYEVLEARVGGVDVARFLDPRELKTIERLAVHEAEEQAIGDRRAAA